MLKPSWWWWDGGAAVVPTVPIIYGFWEYRVPAGGFWEYHVPTDGPWEYPELTGLWTV